MGPAFTCDKRMCNKMEMSVIGSFLHKCILGLVVNFSPLVFTGFLGVLMNFWCVCVLSPVPAGAKTVNSLFVNPADPADPLNIHVLTHKHSLCLSHLPQSDASPASRCQQLRYPSSPGRRRRRPLCPPPLHLPPPRPREQLGGLGEPHTRLALVREVGSRSGLSCSQD